MGRLGQASQSEVGAPEVSIVIPARNEEASLGECLQSLVAQTGVAFEIIVVDDGSTDRTREIAERFSGVQIISPGPLPMGWTGKNNAVIAGASAARGEWLLFTDADTVHLPGSLARALAEAKKHDVDMLSYSPEQITVTFWEIAVLPVVFAELARQYPPSRVSDPASPIAAANGQYILIRLKAYNAVGGHQTVASDLLEDVALARVLKNSGCKIRFRYASDAVRTRMYRNFRQLREGWTKNLALLFADPLRLAIKSLLFWFFAWTVALWSMVTGIAVGLTGRIESISWAHPFFIALTGFSRHWWWNPVAIGGLLFIAQRLRLANFTWDRQVNGTIAGYPMFAYLLLRSKRAHKKGPVSWKGRTYRPAPVAAGAAGIRGSHEIVKTNI